MNAGGTGGADGSGEGNNAAGGPTPELLPDQDQERLALYAEEAIQLQVTLLSLSLPPCSQHIHFFLLIGRASNESIPTTYPEFSGLL